MSRAPSEVLRNAVYSQARQQAQLATLHAIQRERNVLGAEVWAAVEGVVTQFVTEDEVHRSVTRAVRARG